MDRLFRYCLCFLLSFPALAFSAQRVIVVEPSQITRTYEPGSGPYAFSDSRSWKEPVSTQSGSRVELPVKTQRKYSWPSFRSGLKNALKLNPVRAAASAAVAGAVAAVGWVMSPENTGIQKSEPSLDPASTDSSKGEYTWRVTNMPGNYSSPWVACEDFRVTRTAYVKTEVSISGASGNCVFTNYSGVQISTAAFLTRSGSSCPADTTYDPLRGACYPPDALVPVTDADLDSFVADWDDPLDAADAASEISDIPGSFDYPDGYTFEGPSSIIGDPVVTTTTTPSGTEVTTNTPSYSFDYSTNPLSITTTTTNTTTVYNNGTLVSTSTTTNNQGVVDVTPEPSQEIPTDCEFMPTVCEFIAWFKTPADMPDPDLPTPEDDEFKQTYSASFGGSCPAPRTVHTDNFGTLSISWQPICDLAFYIKFLVIGGASLFAAYIGLGISRGNS